MRWVSAFGKFWWDFLIGDTPELTVGILAVLGLALAVGRHGLVAVAAVPLSVALVLGLSLQRAKRHST